MKSLKWWYFLVVMFVVASMSACGGDDAVTDEGHVKPDAEVNDPAGTVVLSMMKGTSGNATHIDYNIYINDSYNFTGGNFASLGKVKGLGNVAHIPTTSWASSVAVEPGYGYVAYAGNRWYRIYVVEEIASTSGGVMGYKVKYETPFKGVDEELNLKQDALTFEAEGGTANLLFDNKNIVPFTYKVESGSEWCGVQTCSSYDYSFLTNGITVTVAPTKSTEKAESVIKLTTAYGKTKTVKVVRSGKGPYVELGQSELAANASEQTYNVAVSSNCAVSDLSVTNTAKWCKAELIDESAALRTNVVKFIGDKPIDETLTRATTESNVKSYKLRLAVAANLENDSRTAQIEIKAKGGKQPAGLVLTQEMANLVFNGGYDVEVSAGKGSERLRYVIYNDLRPGVENFEANSDAAWCNVEVQDSYVIVTYAENINSESRSCKISLSVKGGTLKRILTMTQKGGSIIPSVDKVYLDRTASNQNVTLNTDLTEIEGVSNTSWCSSSYNASTRTLTIRALENTTGKERKATISFKNFTATIEVVQSKYAVGDAYREDGVAGTVKYMNGANRLVASAVLGQFVWSTENIATGATNSEDGRKNMEIIKKIANWKALYPAFAAVEALNTEGVTGWYFPASSEGVWMGLTNYWSSTEYNSVSSYYRGGTINKQKSLSVYGCYRF